jgi:hypothetical protein
LKSLGFSQESFLKTAFISFALTIAAVLLVAKLFFHSILGSMGLAVTGVQQLQSLAASQVLVEKLKSRNTDKKSKLRKRFVKRASRKVLVSSAAAITLGTVAVAATAAGFEIHDYCLALEELNEEAALLYQTRDEYSFEDCIDQGQEDLDLLLSEIKTEGKDYIYEALGLL